jgi:hypothetical protein
MKENHCKSQEYHQSRYGRITNLKEKQTPKISRIPITMNKEIYSCEVL